MVNSLKDGTYGQVLAPTYIFIVIQTHQIPNNSLDTYNTTTSELWPLLLTILSQSDKAQNT